MGPLTWKLSLTGGAILPSLELTLQKANAPPVALVIDLDVITMGRSTECAIPIPDRFLSRKHAELVSESGGWVLRDYGSANGTFLNGTRISSPVKVRPGDHIRLGDTELILGGAAAGNSASPIEDAMPSTSFFLAEGEVKDSDQRSRIVQRLALELIEDRPMAELFDFILDRVVEVMHPSRTALALLTDGSESVEIVKIRRMEGNARDLAISRTLIREVVRDRKVVAFTDDGSNAAIASAQSIVGQSIYSALCAPLIAGERVLGVLYVDYQISRRLITEEDAQMAAQIARVAALKLESTSLRESALEKGLLEETLKLARAIQMRMLPQHFPSLTPGSLFDIAAAMHPATQVGGDFYDFHASAEGKLYFCIGDVSGKGIPAALMMAVSRALFRSFIMAGRDPVSIISGINRQLCDETDETMFVTAICGVLDLSTGEIRYANAGHNPPLIVGKGGAVRPLPTRPGIVLGYLPLFPYVEDRTVLAPGEALYLYTDGISEAMNRDQEIFSVERLQRVLSEHGSSDVRTLLNATLDAVSDFAGASLQSDDLTALCIRFLGPSS